MSNSRLLSLFSVALILSCAGSTLFSMNDSEKTKEISDMFSGETTGWTAADQRQKNFNVAALILLATYYGRWGYAHLMSEDDDVETLKDESSLYRFIDDITQSAVMNAVRQRILLNYQGWGSGSSIGINQFEKDERFENHPNWYASAESTLYMTNTFCILQLRNIKKLQDIAEDTGFNNAPEGVKTATIKLGVGFLGHFITLGEKWAWKRLRPTT